MPKQGTWIIDPQSVDTKFIGTSPPGRLTKSPCIVRGTHRIACMTGAPPKTASKTSPAKEPQARADADGIGCGVRGCMGRRWYPPRKHVMEPGTLARYAYSHVHIHLVPASRSGFLVVGSVITNVFVPIFWWVEVHGQRLGSETFTGVRSDVRHWDAPTCGTALSWQILMWDSIG